MDMIGLAPSSSFMDPAHAYEDKGIYKEWNINTSGLERPKSDQQTLWKQQSGDTFV